MSLDPINELAELFRRLPGIGPRQAKRFVYYLLNADPATVTKLTDLLGRLRSQVKQCPDCQIYFASDNKNERCITCRDTTRDHSLLMIMEKDVDLEPMRRAGVYSGYYFFLGGLVPILDKEPARRVRLAALLRLIESKNKELKEIIIALATNGEGENTVDYLRQSLKSLVEKYDLKLSLLGRGLSTNSELEYTDPETISYAFKNRG
ncbi:MAG: recombination protein RecR [Candidatus Vogelbacteria bacterium]|nr:recombination protein RecR [Candidatus Vogelbacteria bacterium]